MTPNAKLKKIVLATLLGLAASSAIAGQVTTLQPCHTTDVVVNGIAQYDSTAPGAVLGATQAVSSPMGNAAACIGAYSGNDTEYPQTNLGYYGDGLMNGGTTGPSAGSQQLFPNGAFSQLYTPSDLNGAGPLDPGWIMLGKYEDDAFAPKQIGNLTNVVLATFFSLTMTSDHSGTWSFTPDAEVAKRAESILGKNYFDQFMIVFKSGDAWAAYDFTGAQFGLDNPSADDPIYNFFGTWDTSGTLQNCTTKVHPKTGVEETNCNAAGLSHITLYARDPGAFDVPEPASLALIGVALAGLSTVRRRRAKN